MENIKFNPLMAMNNQKQEVNAPQKEDNSTCFEDDGWTTKAADAINKEFENMDELFSSFQNSQFLA